MTKPPASNSPRSGALTFSSEERIMGVLLVFVPATVVGAHVGIPPWIQFFLAVAAVVPLAAFIGSATEALADRLGGKIGGLLNATFGNSPDLLVGIFGVQKGLIPLVKATLIGALISNSALIMGLCCIVAGLKHGRPKFRRDEAGHHSVLMMLTVAAVLFPSVGSYVVCGRGGCTSNASRDVILHVSVAISVVLLLAYTAYIAYGVFGLESVQGSKREGREVRALTEREVEHEKPGWPVAFSVFVLAAATGGLIPITDTLTSSVAPVTQVLGWTEVFVGIVIVANAGNAAEAYAALKFAAQRPAEPDLATGTDSGLDLALGIASASSIQIATFIAPIVVIYSLFAQPMNLVFSPVELSILGLLVIIFTHIAHDGESNWLEGAQLLALYAMAAIIFFALPVSAFVH